MLEERVEFEWRQISKIGKSPPIRTNTQCAHYKGHLWIFLGAGAGVGRSSEVWKFNIKLGTWNEVECKGDIPSARDGHSVTYVGNGKFILFGGQGEPYENEKSVKRSDTIAVKTVSIRELYNSMYQLDAETGIWSRFDEDGAIPMGRRGHSMVFIQPTSKPKPVEIVERKRPNRKVEIDLGIPEKTLILFGGAGIEASKYTEFLFNDLWCYQSDSNLWKRKLTSGCTPRPMFDHSAELFGDQMIVITGLTGSSAVSASKTISSLSVPEILILNTKTLAWTGVDLYDNTGRVSKLRLYGFSICPDTLSGNGCLFVYGGREVVDAKTAAIEAPNKKKGKKAGFAQSINGWRVDINRCTVSPMKSINGGPRGRYGHVSTSTTPIEEWFREISPEKKKKNKDMFEDYDDKLMFTFGGSYSESGGFCDPVVYQYLRTHKFIQPNGSENGDEYDDELASRPSSARSLKSIKSVKSLNESSFRSGDNRRGSIGTYNAPQDDNDQQNEERLTVWEKNASKNPTSPARNPTNWNELKLALTYPLTEKQSSNSPSGKSVKKMGSISGESDFENRSIGGEKSQTSTTSMGSAYTAAAKDALLKRKQLEKIKTLSASLGPIVKGKTMIKAKEDFLKLFPVPDLGTQSTIQSYKMNNSRSQQF
jgi:hypothetical protein